MTVCRFPANACGAVDASRGCSGGCRRWRDRHRRRRM